VAAPVQSVHAVAAAGEAAQAGGASAP
jgi:hypothetical protein